MTAQSKFKEVKKRDGRIVPFDQNRILEAIRKAMEAAAEENSEKDSSRVSDAVVTELNKRYPAHHVPHIEEIQDVVEESLILMDFPKTAKAYILYRQKRAEVRAKADRIPEDARARAAESKKYFRNSLSEFIYYRTYSRWIEDEGRRETWIETVDRYGTFMKANLGSRLTDDEYADIRAAILNQEVMPSMRLLWSAGKAAAATNIAAYNCSFIAPRRLEDFAEIMVLMMCGAGAGFSVENQNIQELPIVSRQTGKSIPAHVIEDSKEGWGNAITLGLKTWYQGMDVAFDYSRLRPAGARLKTMGGRSSGPDPLRSLLDFSRAKILARQGRRLSSLDVHDIICKIGEIVVAGGVRRSALISLSDLDDEEMRLAKTGPFYFTDPQRQMANNSAAYNAKPQSDKFLEEWLALAKSGTGERGIFNRGSLPKQLPERRMKTFEKHLPICGTNPCVPADTWVMTSSGARQVKDLIHRNFEALVNGKLYYSSGFFLTGEKEVFEITTRRGFSFRATADHPVLTVNYRSRKKQINEWKEVKELVLGEEIVLHDHGDFEWGGRGTESEGWLLGNLMGDGNIEQGGKANLDYWGISKEFMMRRAVTLVHSAAGARSDLCGHIAKTGYARVGSVGLGALAAEYGMGYKNKNISDLIESASSPFCQGFLKGWFDADGSVQGNQLKGVSIRLSSNAAGNLKKAQRMLARFGIISSIYENRRRELARYLPDGRGGMKEYFCAANHELIISGVNILRFARRIGFGDPEKNSRLKDLLSKYQRRLNREAFSSEITEIKSMGAQSVYDCSVPGINAFDANGLYLHNCGEIILRSKSFCNLTEVVARYDDSEASLLAKIRLATILGTYQSTLTSFPYLSKEWKENCDEERLLGVSLTGQWDCPAVQNPEILAKLRERAIEVNREYAKRFGINESTCITCVKPSGTVSQLVDSASGMHPRHAPYYIRRVRISATDPLFQMLREQKFPHHPEVGQLESTATTFVLDFPVKAPGGAVFRNDLSAVEQLEHWKTVKTCYTEHNPSVTVSVGKDEWITVADWLYRHWDFLGGLSFLPREEYVYNLAPYEEITEQEYRRLMDKLPEIDFAGIMAYEKEDLTTGSKELACVGNVCEVDVPEKAL